MSIRSPTISNKPKLSARQSQALLMKVQHFTHREIAQALRLSKATIDGWSIEPEFKAAYEALTADLEARSINALQELRTESEALALESLQLLRRAIADPALKPTEKLPLLSEAARWFSLLHPEPRQNIAVAASARAGSEDSQAEVMIYIPANGRDPCPGAVPESETWGDAIDVEPT